MYPKVCTASGVQALMQNCLLFRCSFLLAACIARQLDSGHCMQVTEDDIEKYHREYRGSAEETADLLQLYERFRGNMDQVSIADFCFANASGNAAASASPRHSQQLA